MIDNNLWFHLLAGTILLIIGLHAGAIFLKWHTKYNLATLLVIIILFVGTILSYFYPGRLNTIFTSLGMGITGKIILVVIAIILLYAFLFYPDIKRFLSQRKTKNK